jgi:hypothetical protein
MFFYAQARLQARHGERPVGTDWLRLQGAGDVANYLLIARQTSLKPWVLGLHANSSSHEIELSIRQQFRLHVIEVSNWLPSDWRTAVRWVRRLVDLPIINHLLADESVPAWLFDDPELKIFAIEDFDLRMSAIRDSDCSVLVDRLQTEIPIYEGWNEYWQELWPKRRQGRAGLEYLSALFRKQIEAQCSDQGVHISSLRESLEHDLVTLFRRYRAQPAASFAHLALTALDMERLRGDLVRRALFPEHLQKQPL